MTAKTPERRRFEAAREAAEQLAVVVGESTPEAAASWLRIRIRDENFSLIDLALTLASMIPPDDAYKPVVAERFGTGKKR